MTRSDDQRITDITFALHAISRSKALLAQDPHNSELEATVLAAVTHHIFIIGEAVKSLSPELRTSLPDVPWRDIIRQRDFIGHHYFALESAMIWSTIDKPLAQLQAALAHTQ